MGLAPRRDDETDSSIWTAGAGILAATGSAPDGTFLKRRSGVPMSERASAYAQQNGYVTGSRAHISRARLANSSTLVLSEVSSKLRSIKEESLLQNRRKSQHQ